MTGVGQTLAGHAGSASAADADSDALATSIPRVARVWADTGPDDDLHRRIDGSVVFVDISGFTKMSERLARFGNVGAEHVTEVIGSRFSRLLTDAYDHGATLLKFGGDALLLFFSGDAHERAAVAAAYEMRNTLRQIATVATDAGTVILRMTVGVHSGPFDFFLVGGSHRELIVAGPTASAAVAIEGAARTGQIVIGPATAAALPAANVGTPTGPGFALRGTIAEPRPGAVVLPEVDRDLRPLVPVALREVLGGPEGRSEHRRVTVAFLHFSGLDALVARSPDAAAAGLDELVRIVQEAIDPRGVCFLATDVDADGGKIILTAGAPLGSGEDEEQMLLALREIVERQPSLPLQIGVNAGPVFAGDIGTTFRRNYTVMGDAVNLAARRHGPRAARAAPRDCFSARQLSHPVRDRRARAVLRQRQAPTGHGVLGRARAGCARRKWPARSCRSSAATRISRVVPVIDGLTSGRGGVIEIVGDPGAGKSRFFSEIERRAAGIPVRTAQCRLYQAATPYFPIGQLLEGIIGVPAGSDEAATRLEQVVSVAAPRLRPWLPLIGIPLGLELADTEEVAQLDESFRKQRLEDAVIELLAVLLNEPTILCFEDTHWMDDSSGDLVRRARRARLRTSRGSCASRGGGWRPVSCSTLLRVASGSSSSRSAGPRRRCSWPRRRRPRRCRSTWPTSWSIGPTATRCSSSSCSVPSAKAATSPRCPARSRV